MKKLKCHCGLVEAEINIDNFGKILRCNCSICKRKGAIMSIVKNEDFKIIKGKEYLKLYKFHSKIAQHYFCSNCGIYTHHPSNITISGCFLTFCHFRLESLSSVDLSNFGIETFLNFELLRIFKHLYKRSVS